MWGFLLGLAYGFGVGGLFRAFSLGPISLVAPLTAGYPVLTVLWGVANGLEPTLLQWACVAATLIGALIIARSGTEEGGINAVEPGKMPLLLLFCAMSVLGYSAAVVLGQHAAVEVGEIEAAWLSRATSILTLLPFVLTERNYTPISRWHWIGLAVMGVLDVLGLIAINASGHLPGKDFAGVGISAYGALSVLLAMIFLKEKVSPGQWLGLAMIVGAVATISLSQS
jgi:drug/metabolite transporter (DMT)-like permease